MLGIESSGTLRREELYDALFQSFERQFGDSGKSLEEQAQAFFSKMKPMTLVVAFRQNGAEGILKGLSSELRSYILGILEECEKSAKKDLQENEETK